MNVCISVKGRFHAFYLARELEKRGALAQLITSYPAFEVCKYGIDSKRVSSVVSTELLSRAWKRAPRTLRSRMDAQPALGTWYEKRATKRIQPGADLFVGWSGVSLSAIRRAKTLGMKTVVERGSSHILFQRDTLAEEFERIGLKARLPHPAVVDKELAEYEEADYIAVPSLYAKDTFLEQGVPESKLIHVPYGVGLESFEPVTKKDDVFRVMHCGAVDVQKGGHLLLQAFHELDLPNAELWFVGGVNPELAPWIERYADERVHFKGFQPQSELKKFYGQASVFCLASIQEGLAMVLLQAMACGLPVIASRNTGADDIVRNTQDGFVVPTRDVEALKDKLAWLADNPDARAVMGRAARERVLHGFTWSDYGNRITAAYTRVLLADPQDGQRAA